MMIFLKPHRPFTLIAITVAVLLSLTALNNVIIMAHNENSEKIVAESDKIMVLANMWSDKLAEGDLNWIMNLHAADAIQFPAGAEMIQGKEALKAAWEGIISTKEIEISWESTTAFVSASNDMAYDYGIVKVKNADGSVENGKYVVVWTRENGEWKIALDIFNSDGTATK
ncbi:MAG: DUF4440 domain-containing protein [Candidatus Zixiibacteriota bacterium]